MSWGLSETGDYLAENGVFSKDDRASWLRRLRTLCHVRHSMTMGSGAFLKR